MKSETKWTQGPWETIQLTDGSWSVGGFAKIGGDNDEQARANARLIAAAPDLYEALAACEKALGGMADAAFRVGIEGTAEWDQIAGGNNLFGTRDKVREALSKARGEE